MAPIVGKTGLSCACGLWGFDPTEMDGVSVCWGFVDLEPLAFGFHFHCIILYTG